MDEQTQLPTEKQTPQHLENDLIPITEAVEIIPPAKEYKEFNAKLLQVLPTITIEEISVLMNELGIAVRTLDGARRLAKYPNIVLLDFNSNDYAPAEEPFL